MKGAASAVLLASWLAACETASEAPIPDGLAIRAAPDQATVLLVSWEASAERPDRVDVEWSDDGSAWSRTPATEGEPWEAVIFGLRPGTEYRVRARLFDAAGESTTPEHRITTEFLPGEAPQLLIEEQEYNDAFLAVGVNNTASGGAIFDASGVAVWWWPVPVPTLLVTRVLRSVDQRTVLVSQFRTITDEAEEDYAIFRVAYDGRLVETLATPAAHHDFTELPDGTLAWLASEPRKIDGRPIMGDTIVERSPDGVERTVWSAWTDFQYDPEDPRLDDRFLHANALRYDAPTGRYWVSLRNYSQLIVVDRESGALVERFFGDDSSFPLEPGRPTDHQHSFNLLPTGFVVMDDRSRNDVSRAVEYGVDREVGSFVQTWEFFSDRDFHLPGLGDVMRADNGDTVMIWSSAGQIQRVTPEGETTWRATTELGTFLGYGQRTSDPAVLP